MTETRQSSKWRTAFGAVVMAAFLATGTLAAAAKTSKPGPSAKKTMKPKPVPKAKAKRAKAPASTAVAAMKPAPAMKPVPLNERDPFSIPKPVTAEGKVTETQIEPTGTGTRSLVIGQLKVEGIVREDKTNKMIAVVTGRTNLAYFLRENDTVYDGVVSKITPDSVHFTENYLDDAGRMTTRDVIKPLGGGPGEKQ